MTQQIRKISLFLLYHTVISTNNKESKCGVLFMFELLLTHQFYRSSKIVLKQWMRNLTIWNYIVVSTISRILRLLFYIYIKFMASRNSRTISLKSSRLFMCSCVTFYYGLTSMSNKNEIIIILYCNKL